MASDHLEERVLALFLDNELDDHEQAALQEHLDACPECRSAVESLRSGAGVLSSILGQADAEVPAITLRLRRHRTNSWHPFQRVAAAAAVVGLLLMAISPARAWIIEQASHIGGRLFSAEQAPMEVPVADSSPGPIAPRNMIGVSIPVTSNVLRIRLTNRQLDGILTVSVAEVGTPSAEIDDGGDERLVLSDGLVIVNRTTSTANYHVRIPRHLTVELFVLEEPVRRFVFEEGGVDSWEVDLRSN